jgi:hypothetical protein
MVYATCIAPQRVHSLKARGPYIYKRRNKAPLLAHRFRCCGTKKEVESQPDSHCSYGV